MQLSQSISNPVSVKVEKQYNQSDFDVLTYSDVHIGMDTNSKR